MKEPDFDLADAVPTPAVRPPATDGTTIRDGSETISETLVTTDSDEPDAFARPAGWLARLTIADALFGLILVAAAIIRLVALDRVPLSPNEAQEALAVWRFWQPVGGEATFATKLVSSSATFSSPAYFTLTALLSQVGGFGDATMRLVPALFGIGLVALPWWLRPQLGVRGALVTTCLLAASPLATIAARTASGDAIALFALMLFVVAWLRLVQPAEREPAQPAVDFPHDSRWFYLLLVAVGLGLTTSPLFYTGLVTLAFAWVVWRAIGPSAVVMGRREAWQQEVTRNRGILIGAAVFVALSTLFLSYLPGLGTAASLPARWLAQFSLQGGLPALLNPFLAIARYEIVLLPLGLTAIAWVIWREQPLANFCVYWLAGLFILMLLQPGVMSNALLVTLPGYLLLGRFAHALLSDSLPVGSWRSRAVWLVAGGGILVGMVGLAHLARYGRISLYTPQELAHVWLLLTLFVFAAVTLYYLWTWDSEVVAQGTLLAFLALFLFYHWGTAWWLGHHAANDPRERWVQTATDDELPQLVTTLRHISQQITGADTDLAIFSGVDTPVLRWYLRDFRQMQWGDGLPVGLQTDVVITPDGNDPLFGSDYMGSDFGLVRTDLQPETTASATPLLSTLRWWLFHQSSAVVNQERVVLWVRTDLTN